MRLEDFSYDLPKHLIAQTPIEDRAASRLMVVDRAGDGPPADHSFREFPNLLDPGDVVVINRSRVVRARMFVRRDTGEG